MNRERAKELLPIIQAIADGKTLQVLAADKKWRDMVNISLLDGYVYRIKPEPREIYVNEYNGQFVGHADFATANNASVQSVLRVGVKYREVIEE